MFIDLVALFLFYFFSIYICIFLFSFSLFVSVYVYASLCDFICIVLLLPLVLRFCLSIFFFFFILLFPFLFLMIFFILITLFYLFIYFSFFLCFLPFFLSCVADRVLVLQPGDRPEPLRWERRVQDIGPPETSRLHVISNSENCPRDLHLNTKTQLYSMTSKLKCWTPYANQLARQEYNPTH